MPCSQVKSNEAKDTLAKSNKTTKEFIEYFAMCPSLTEEELKELYVEKNQLDPPMAQMQVNVFPCANTNPNCVLDLNTFKRIDLVSVLPQRTFEPDNMGEPVNTISSVEEIFTIDYRLTKFVKLQLNNIELYDDKYDFFKESLKKSYSDIDRISTNFGFRELTNVLKQDLECDPENLDSCQGYVTIDIISSGKSVTITRSYPKIFNVIGELGGFIDIVMLIFGILYVISKIQKDTEQIKKALLGNLFSAEREHLQSKLPGDKKKEEEKLKEIEETEQEILDEAQDGILLQRRMLEVGVLNDFLFKDFHKALMPFLIKKQAENRLQRQKVLESSNVFASLIAGNSSRTIDPKQQQIYGKKQLEVEMSGKEAFQKLWNSEPHSELEKAIRDYFLANLPDDITETKSEAIPQDSIFSKFLLKEKSDIVKNPQQTSENFSFLRKFAPESRAMN